MSSDWKKDGGRSALQDEEDNAPLLSVPSFGLVAPNAIEELDHSPGNLKKEVGRIFYLAGPLALQDLLVFLQGAITVGFVGRLDPRSLSAMILCSTTFNMSGMSLVMGVASGAETLSGQCFGARNFGALGVTLQKSLLINWVACVLIFMGWTQIHHFLAATGQPQDLAVVTIELLWLWSPVLVAIGTTECLKRYLMAQNLVVPTCLVYVVCTAIAPLVNWVMIFGLGLGLRGSAYAYNIVSWMNCVGLLLYISYHHRQLAGSGRETWLGWSWKCLEKWGEYLKLAIPSTVMLCLEWWTFEIIILMSGEMEGAEVNLGVMGIMFTLGGLCYMIPIGLGGAASTRVANELGEGRPGAAKTAVKAALIAGLCTQSIISMTVYFGRSVWGYALSSDPVVVERIALLLPLLSIMIPADGANAAYSGVVRGCGRQTLAVGLNLLTFWGVGLPMCALLGFKLGMGVRGLWFGMVTVVWVQTLCMTGLVSCLDWSGEAKRAAQLVSSNAVHSKPTEGRDIEVGEPG